MLGQSWQKTFFRIVSNPAFEAIAAALIIGLAVYVLVDTDPLVKSPHLPVITQH